MSVAQLPGSMYPTETRYAGPVNASRRRNQWPRGMATLRWTSSIDTWPAWAPDGPGGAGVGAGAVRPSSSVPTGAATPGLVVDMGKLQCRENYGTCGGDFE